MEHDVVEHDETLLDITSETARKNRPSSLFYIWFASNLTVGDFYLGVVLEDYNALPFIYMVIILALANIAGGLLIGIMSYYGPVYGKGQMEVSKDFFGITGGRIFSVLQFVNTIGWLTVNLIIAATALSLIISLQGTYGAAVYGIGINYFYLVAILITLAVLYLTVIYGQKSIKMFEWAMALILGILFLHMAIVICQTGPHYVNSIGSGWSIYTMAGAFMLSFSYIMSWGPYASDYSRYVKDTVRNRRRSLIFAMAGSGIASFLVEVIAYVTAANINLGGNATLTSIFVYTFGYFWIIGAMAFFLGGLSANSINLYSNIMSARAVGARYGKNIMIIAVFIIITVLSIYFYSTFSTYFEGFLYVLDYWITPWLGVMIAEFFIVKKKTTSSGINWNPILAYIIGIAASYPFMDTITIFFNFNVPFYGITQGADISYGISFILAIVLTILFERFLPWRKNTSAMAA